MTASRGVTITGDCRLEDCLEEAFDMIVLPGGIPGAEHLRDAHGLKAMLNDHRDAGRPYAAICAAPAVVLEPFGLLDGVRATCHPSFGKRLSRAPEDDRVVTDGLVTTSQGPGTALEFALELVRRLLRREGPFGGGPNGGPTAPIDATVDRYRDLAKRRRHDRFK